MISELSLPPMPARFAEFSEERLRALQTAALEPRPQPTPAQTRAAYRAAHPPLSPAQALASNAEAAPPNTTDPRDSTHVSKVHTEIIVNGKVIARVFNSGAAAIASEYSFLSDEIDFASDKMVGPMLAEDRAKRITAVLQRYGAVMKDDNDPSLKLSPAATLAPVLELLKADTAQTQDRWLEQEAKQGRLHPGSLFSSMA